MNIFTKLREIFGSLSSLASLLDLGPVAVYQWKARGVIPQKHCARIVELSRGQLTLNELRPDLYPLQRVA